MSYYIADRITVNPEQCGGHPCIRGMRIRVVDVLELLAAGLSFAEVLEELPDLELADVFAVDSTKNLAPSHHPTCHW